jgi:hypothetical protein
LVPEALTERLDLRPGDAHQLATAGSDALVDARPAAMADGILRAPADGAVGKLAVRAQDAPARDARQSADRAVPALAVELCKPDAVRFAEQSSAGAVWPEVQASAEPLKRVQRAQQVAQPPARQAAGSILSARWRAGLGSPRDVATQKLKGAQALALERSASPQAERAELPGPEAL